MPPIPNRSLHYTLTDCWNALVDPEADGLPTPIEVIAADLAFVRRLLGIIEPVTPDAAFAEDLLGRILAPSKGAPSGEE